MAHTNEICISNRYGCFDAGVAFVVEEFKIFILKPKYIFHFWIPVMALVLKLLRQCFG